MKAILMGGKPQFKEILQWSIENGLDIVGVVCDQESEEYCRSQNIPIIQEKDIIDKYDWYKNNTDVIISYLYWNILKDPIISLPKYGCINFHPAPLPDYKGLAGCTFAILNEEFHWGVTAHYINKGIDTGDIIKVDWFNFDWRKETAFSLKQKTLSCQQEQYKNVISELIKEKTLLSMPQNPSEGTYYSKKDMLNAMKIDLENDNIDKKIQAFWFPPHEGAYIEIKGERYTLVNDVVLNSFK